MYNQQPMPFHMTYPVSYMFENEQNQEHEAQLMKSYYSNLAARIQDRVERECDKMEYEGSIMYDEYPDKLMMAQISSRIEEQIQNDLERGELENQEWNDYHRHHHGEGRFNDLIGVLLFNEIFRRRCRHGRCRRYF